MWDSPRHTYKKSFIALWGKRQSRSGMSSSTNYKGSLCIRNRCKIINNYLDKVKFHGLKVLLLNIWKFCKNSVVITQGYSLGNSLHWFIVCSWIWTWLVRSRLMPSMSWGLKIWRTGKPSNRFFRPIHFLHILDLIVPEPNY